MVILMFGCINRLCVFVIMLYNVNKSIGGRFIDGGGIALNKRMPVGVDDFKEVREKFFLLIKRFSLRI